MQIIKVMEGLKALMVGFEQTASIFIEDIRITDDRGNTGDHFFEVTYKVETLNGFVTNTNVKIQL